MHASPPRLSQLPRLRGLWVLAMAALLLKLLSSSFCATDGVRSLAILADEGRTTTSVQSVATSLSAAGGEASDCMLGEGASCHCSCTHAVPLPISFAVAANSWFALTRFPSPPPASLAKITNSVLRPPIA